MKFTPATAHKKIKQLTEKKQRLEQLERDSKSYICAIDEEPLIPEYDYEKITAEITRIDREVVMIKHAINEVNLEAKIMVEDSELAAHVYTIDQILIEMAQLNHRKGILENMINKQPKSRVDNIYSSRNNIIEYEYLNYDLDTVRRDYEHIDNKITNMQLALDKYNQTYEFEIHGYGENI